MIILCKKSLAHQTHTEIVLIFGIGLIGLEIVNALTKTGYSPFTHDFSWTDRQQQASDASSIIDKLRTLSHDPMTGTGHGREPAIDVVWAAGKCGFVSSCEELEEEKKSFQRILELHGEISSSGLCNSARFHLVSSAGGLFESQKLINETSTPSPCRPYGNQKLQLEQLLLDTVDNRICFIYRPSSVYGFINSGRFGFISTLLKNGLLNKEVNILGSMNTLRDYVFSADIGQHIANRITSNNTSGSIEMLASGKPTSILQLKLIVEQIINKKIYICCSSSKANHEDITFDVNGLPVDWQPTEINLGIRKIYNDFF